MRDDYVFLSNILHSLLQKSRVMKGNSPPDQNENPVDPSDNHIQNLSCAERLHQNYIGVKLCFFNITS